MAHWVGNTRDYNGFIRQARACLLNAPRVKRTTTKDLAITGYEYKDITNANRLQSDIGFAIAETDCRKGVYRATCVKAGGTATWSAGSAVTVTITGTNTIQDDANGNWVTKGFAVGDLIKIEAAVDAGNNNTFRISAINNNNATNDQLVVATEDTLTNTTSDAITAYPIGGGAIFEVEYDNDGDGNPTADEHVGWIASNIEHYTKAFDLWMALNRGNADWAVGDYWQFELENGPLTQWDRITNTVRDVVISGTNTLTLSATDQAVGLTWAKLGYSDEDRIDISVSSGTDTGIYRISAITDSALTLQTTAGGAPGLTNETVTIQAAPKFEVSSDPVLSVVPTDPTITRDDVGGSWVDDGFLPGGHILLEGTVSNDGYWLVKTVTATVLTLDDSNEAFPLVTETLPATITVSPWNGTLQAWSEDRFRLKASGTILTSDNDAITAPGNANGLLIRPDSEGNYVTEWIGVGPGIDPINDLKQVNIGMQSQYDSSVRQNVEHRCFDIVSDNAFNLESAREQLRIYTYLSVGSTMETFMQFDGDHIVGFTDVNTATTSWFYQGFINLHGTPNQIPLPYFLAGNSFIQTFTRDTSNASLTQPLCRGVSEASGTAYEEDPDYSSNWFRWVDGQWFGVFTSQWRSGLTGTLSVNPLKMAVWPWQNGTSYGSATTTSWFWNALGGGSNQMTIDIIARMGRTPVAYDPTNRNYTLLPAVLWMEEPTINVIGEIKSIFAISGVGGLATKDRQTRGHRVFYIGQSHKETNVDDFIALELD